MMLTFFAANENAIKNIAIEFTFCKIHPYGSLQFAAKCKESFSFFIYSNIWKKTEIL